MSEVARTARAASRPDPARPGPGGEVTRPAGLRAGFHAEVGDAAVSGLWHAGEQWAPTRFRIPRHTHPVWEFYLQLHGESHWCAAGRPYLLRPGTLLAVAPGVVHHMARRTAATTHFSFAGIAVERVLQRHPELRAPWHRAPKAVHRTGSLPLAGAFDQLVHELTLARGSTAAGLVLAVDRLVLEAGRLLTPGGAAPRLATHPSVQRVRAVLDQDHARRWTLRDLGLLVDLAPAYLTALFTAQVGMSPHRYLLQRRIERAKHLLATSDLPITEVGIEVGFGSGQHFARVFRHMTSDTPSGYRRAARAAAPPARVPPAHPRGARPLPPSHGRQATTTAHPATPGPSNNVRRTMTADTRPARVAIVGTGHRAQTFTEGFARRPHLTVAALCDRNPVRIAHHQRLLTDAGEPEPTAWAADDFTRMLAKEDITQVLVTTMDSTHDHYIVAALEAGCRVVTEKPMTVDSPRCRRILDTLGRTGGDLAVAFNYRFNPVHELVWRQLSDGVIGNVLSVHFEWDLDVRHGADYFRRWHREKLNSGGLMVHKSGHHFDLVNWWLGARPEQVFGYGMLGFYGREAGLRNGYRRAYERAHGAPEAADDPFALHLVDNPGLRSLYLDAESEDGYLRDRNVFGDGITIEDDMALVVRYSTGATMSYHLHAYAPGEGYRVLFNGTGGRLELDVVESRWQPPSTRVESAKGSVHGDTALAHAGGATITVRPLWREPYEVPIPAFDHAGHGGGDARMMDTLFGPVDPAGSLPEVDHATAVDGALALATGLAANESFVSGQPVNITDVVEIPER